MKQFTTVVHTALDRQQLRIRTEKVDTLGIRKSHLT